MERKIIDYMEKKEQSGDLLDYLKNIVEPTLSMMWIYHKQGKIEEEEYITLVSCLTEIFRDYGEEVEVYLDALWENYGEELPLGEISTAFSEWKMAKISQ